MEALASFFREGGIFMYIILGVFAIGIAIMVERGYILIHKCNVDARALWAKISKYIQDGDTEKARVLCKGSHIPLMRVLDAGLLASAGSERDIQNAIDEIALEIIPSIDKRIVYLSTLANVATLLGLLGTIQGLVQAFAAVGHAEPSQKAALLAGGISVALYTTAFGLIVAIPLLVSYAMLQSKSHKIIDEIDEFSVRLINLLNRRRGGIQTK